MLPLMLLLKTKVLFLLLDEHLNVFVATGALRDQRALLEMVDNIFELMFTCKILNIAHQSREWYTSQRIGYPMEAVKKVSNTSRF